MKLDVQRRLGGRVADLRRKEGITQDTLAERCGWTVKYISEIERGRVNVPLQSLGSLSRGLRITISELLLGVDAPLPREIRTVEVLLAGRSRGQQKAAARLLAAVADLMHESSTQGRSEL